MKECGYTLTADYLAEVVDSSLDDTSATGYSYNCDSLAQRYLHLGLEVRRHGPDGDGGASPVGCKICGDFKDQPWFAKGLKSIPCDPAKHKAYYDALERA